MVIWAAFATRLQSKCQRVYKPGFVLIAERRPFIWDADYPAPLAAYPDGGVITRHIPSLFGLAPDGVYHTRFIAKTAVRSYRTFSPLPHQDKSRMRRFVFCGTFPKRLHARRALSGILK